MDPKIALEIREARLKHRPDGGMVPQSPSGMVLEPGEFHWAGGMTFKRLENGVVRIRTWDAMYGSWTCADTAFIDADGWASIVASVSWRGEDGETFRQARDFHG